FKPLFSCSFSQNLTTSFIRIVMISALGSVQYGYNLWVIYSPTVVRQMCKRLFHNEEQYEIFMLGVTVSLFPLGGVIGALVVGPLVDSCGRKGTLLINSFFSMVASMFMVCASMIHSYAFTMFARFLIGISIGVFSTVIPMYLGEISPLNLRGIIGVLPHLSLTVGVTVAQVLAFREVMGTQEGWPILMSLSGILALFQAIIVPSFPESPRYLLIQKKDEDKAREALKKLWHKDDVDNEMEEIRQEVPPDKEDRPMNALKLLCYRNLQWQVFSVIILMCGQQLSGINAVYFYTERTYLSTGIGKDSVRYITLVSTILLFIALLFGRRILLISGFGICSVLCVVLTVTLELQVHNPQLQAIHLPFTLPPHPGSLPNLIITELFLQSSRSSAFVIGGCIHWLLNFLTIVTFINIQKYTGPYVFLICCPICCGSLMYILKVVPETKGKTFLEIKRNIPMYVHKKKIRNKKSSRRKVFGKHIV
uniref:Solute carrier family 2, facilitated glucose transporter member 5 n=1 Tax=Salvator merianae TaxID=96440 RepID=A0A8D0BUB8_SALMN